jgi:hypothetical protein
VSSLTLAELAWLAAQIRPWPGGWTLETVAEPGELSAILLPAEGDRFAATFLVDRVESGIRVMACRWDIMDKVGVFPTLDAALAPIAAASASAAQAAPFPNLQ